MDIGGINMPYPKQFDEKIAIKLKKEGYSYQQIADKLGVYKNAIWKRIKDKVDKVDIDKEDYSYQEQMKDEAIAMIRSWYKQAEKVNFNWKPNKKRFLKMKELIDFL